MLRSYTSWFGWQSFFSFMLCILYPVVNLIFEWNHFFIYVIKPIFILFLQMEWQGVIKNYILYAPHPSIWSIFSLTASTFLTEYRSLSTALDFRSNLACGSLLLSYNWDVWYASQGSVGLLFLFPDCTSFSLLLTAGALLTIFNVASSASKLTNTSTDNVPRTLSALLSP